MTAVGEAERFRSSRCGRDAWLLALKIAARGVRSIIGLWVLVLWALGLVSVVFCVQLLGFRALVYWICVYVGL